MKFLKRLFGKRKHRSSGDSPPALARELESTIAEAERLVAAGRFEEAMNVAEGGLRRFPTASRLRSVVQYVRSGRAGLRCRC